MSESPIFSKDRVATYDARIQRMVPGYQVLHDLAGTILSNELSETASILVAGAGTGMEVLGWGPRHLGWNFVGVEPSAAMLDIAKEKLSQHNLLERTTLVHGTIDQLPPDKPFDAAALLLVLHFLPDDGQKAGLLGALAERMQPGAPLVMASLFGDPESTRYKKMLGLARAWGISQGVDSAQVEAYCDPARKDLHVVSEERVKILLREAGFIDVQRFYQAAAIGAWFARSPR